MDPGQNYHDYTSLTQELREFATQFPSLCRLISIGESVENRDIWALKISDNPDIEEIEPEFKYLSTMHGNKIIGIELCLYLIDHLLNAYGTDTDITSLIDNTEIWIVPLINPDGLENIDSGGKAQPKRENAHDVDLNRRFPDGSDGNLGNIYDGPAIDSSGLEPEVAAIIQWSVDHNFVLSANFHTGDLGVIYPYGNFGTSCNPTQTQYSATPDDDLFQKISKTYSFIK